MTYYHVVNDSVEDSDSGAFESKEMAEELRDRLDAKFESSYSIEERETATEQELYDGPMILFLEQNTD